jgi:hypothetical protein
MDKNLNHTWYQMKNSPLNIELSRNLILRGLTLLVRKYDTLHHFSSPKLTLFSLYDFFKVSMILNKSLISPISRKTILEGLQLLAHQNTIEEEAWYGLLVITSSLTAHPPQEIPNNNESRMEVKTHER